VKIITQVALLTTILIVSCGTASARTNLLIGGLTIGYEYTDRSGESQETGEEQDAEVAVTETTDTSGDSDQNVREIYIEPLLVISSESAKDRLLLRYKAKLSYDHELQESDIDHSLLLSAKRKVNNRWKVWIEDALDTADRQDSGVEEGGDSTDSSDAEVGQETTDSSETDQYGRRRYLKNAATFGTRYTYLEDSDVGFNYMYSILRNEEVDTTADPYRDYDIHEGALSASYRYNPEWKVTGLAKYVTGDYFEPGSTSDTTASETEDQAEQINIDEDVEIVSSEDLQSEQITALATVDTDIVPHNPLFFTYQYQSIGYDSSLMTDVVIQSGTFGWKHDFTEDAHMSLAGGPTYIEPDDQEGYWGYNGQADLDYQFRDFDVKLGLETGYEKDMYSSDDEEVLSNYCIVKGDVTCEPLQDLFVTVSGSFRQDDKESLSIADTSLTAIDGEIANESGETSKYTERLYKLGARVNYRFQRYYSATLGYQYSDFDTDVEGGDYTESLVYLMLGAEKELLQW